MKICDVITEAGNMNNWYDKKSKAQFKRDELEYELRHEKDQDTGPFYLYKGKEYDSRKLVKGRDGQPFVFYTMQALHKAVNTMSQKSFNKGMKFWKSRSAQENQ